MFGRNRTTDPEYRQETPFTNVARWKVFNLMGIPLRYTSDGKVWHRLTDEILISYRTKKTFYLEIRWKPTRSPTFPGGGLANPCKRFDYNLMPLLSEIQTILPKLWFHNHPKLLHFICNFAQCSSVKLRPSSSTFLGAVTMNHFPTPQKCSALWTKVTSPSLASWPAD